MQGYKKKGTLESKSGKQDWETKVRKQHDKEDKYKSSLGKLEAQVGKQARTANPRKENYKIKFGKQLRKQTMKPN